MSVRSAVKSFPELSLMRECELAATDCWLVMTRWRWREGRREEEGERRQNSKQKMCELMMRGRESEGGKMDTEGRFTCLTTISSQ